jgi:hypothetical protein
VFGASATALYGINLLLNPVPPEQYKLHPEVSDKKQKKAAAKPGKQKKWWWRRKAKGDAKEAEVSDVSDADTGNDSKVGSIASPWRCRAAADMRLHIAGQANPQTLTNRAQALAGRLAMHHRNRNLLTSV